MKEGEILLIIAVVSIGQVTFSAVIVHVLYGILNELRRQPEGRK